MNITDQSKLYHHASECCERFKASSLSTHAGGALAIWHELDPERGDAHVVA